VVSPFTAGLIGLRTQNAPHVIKDSMPVTVSFHFFMEVIQLLVTDTNKYHSQYLDTLDSDGKCLQLLDVTVQEMYFSFDSSYTNGM
jgi:hypothetical protein